MHFLPHILDFPLEMQLVTMPDDPHCHLLLCNRLGVNRLGITFSVDFFDCQANAIVKPNRVTRPLGSLAKQHH